jgi:DNA-binding beta-propeller fold protein YncE
VRNRLLLITVFLLVVVALGESQKASKPTLKQIAAIDLPGPPGKRFEYLTIDFDDDYLLSSHLAAGLLYVIDLKTNRLVKSIPRQHLRSAFPQTVCFERARQM